MPATILREGLVWPESPRWHEGGLWLTEGLAAESGVRVLGDDGRDLRRIPVTGGPAGLDFLADGSAVLALAFKRKLVVLRPGRESFEDFIDLVGLAHYPNELIVAPGDRILVSDSAFQVGKDAFEMGRVLLAEASGEVRVLSEDLAFPNGLAISPDGRTLTVAESFGGRLSCFDVDGRFTLSNRRSLVRFDDLGVVEDLEGIFAREVVPDGICVDAQGSVWVANSLRPSVRCVSQAGEIIGEIDISQGGIACALGGSDGKTLYVTTGDAADMEGSRGRIEIARVSVPRPG